MNKNIQIKEVKEIKNNLKKIQKCLYKRIESKQKKSQMDFLENELKQI